MAMPDPIQRDMVTEVRVLWREVNGQAFQSYVPKEHYDLAFPLYVRHVADGWAVFHAGEHMRIRGQMKRDQAILFLLAVKDLVDWSLPVGKIITQNIGINATLDQVARRVLNGERRV